MAVTVGFIKAIGVVMIPEPTMIVMLEEKFNIKGKTEEAVAIKAILKKTLKEE